MILWSYSLQGFFVLKNHQKGIASQLWCYTEVCQFMNPTIIDVKVSTLKTVIPKSP